MRRRTARRDSIELLSKARGQSEPAGAASLLGAALMGYVADRFDLTAGGMTRGETVEHLKTNGADASMVQHVDEILSECEGLQFGGRSGEALDGLTGRVESCINQMEAARF